MTDPNGLILGIDASNLRRGGGVTHLIELLSAADPAASGFSRVVVWSGAPTLAKLPERSWLDKANPEPLNGGLLGRTWWQRTALSATARKSGCDVLFVPGGSFAGNFHPVVAMSQNLLPFEWGELRRYGLTPFAAKLLLLRLAQIGTFRRSEGVVFLTPYAEQVVRRACGRLSGSSRLIAHGIDRLFLSPPRPQRSIGSYSSTDPFELIYVSTVDLYKHQTEVVRAVALLRAEGLPLVLRLVGPAYAPALRSLEAVMDTVDPSRDWVSYAGSMPREKLRQAYLKADLGVFASSCENQPIILLETMGAGLPIACSNRGPMPDMLGTDGVYFDPESVASIAAAIGEIVASPDRRAEMAAGAFRRAATYSWERCATETFGFLGEVARAAQAG